MKALAASRDRACSTTWPDRCRRCRARSANASWRCSTAAIRPMAPGCGPRWPRAHSREPTGPPQGRYRRVQHGCLMSAVTRDRRHAAQRCLGGLSSVGHARFTALSREPRTMAACSHHNRPRVRPTSTSSKPRTRSSRAAPPRCCNPGVATTRARYQGGPDPRRWRLWPRRRRGEAAKRSASGQLNRQPEGSDPKQRACSA